MSPAPHLDLGSPGRSAWVGPSRAVVRRRIDVGEELDGPVQLGARAELLGRSRSGAVISLDARSGRRLDADVSAAARVPPVALAAPRVLPVPLPALGALLQADGGAVRLLDRAGASRWQVQLDAPSAGLALDMIRRRIYASTIGGTLSALDAGSGRLHWSLRTGSAALGALAVAPSGVVYCGSAAGLHAVSAAGHLLWTAPARGGVVHAPVLLDGGAAYAGALALHAVSEAGAPRWTFPLGAELVGPPAVDLAGRLFVALADGRVLALRDAGDRAEPIWSLRVEPAPSGAPVVGPGGALFVPSGAAVLELGAPPGGGAEPLASGCPCAVAQCAPQLAACALEPGCQAIADCAVAHGCRGSACRLPSTCDATIRDFGGVTSPSHLVAAALDACVAERCPACG